MFRNRQSRKPSEELYKNFKATFPHHLQYSLASSAALPETSSLTDALDLPLSSKPHDQDIKDVDVTPRGSNEPWSFVSSGLTPSLMDPSSASFNMFANQMPGYYTPNSGGTNLLIRSQAGDLHTPGLGGGMWTPLSLPTSEGGMHASQHTFTNFQPNMAHHIEPQQFQNINPFQMQQQQQPQQAFPPHHFTHQPSFESIERVVNDSPADDSVMDFQMHQQPHSHAPEIVFRQQTLHNTIQNLPHPTGESFRFHATLNAPTAMIKHSDEIPVTYLNKGQAYTLSVVDTQNTHPSTPVRYRTFVRVSFEDEQQRLKPAACWQLWKEGRGTNEAHQRGGRLQAVEYVESGQHSGTEDPSKPKIELESASFDGFCVLWSPPAGTAECPISVRFNFLSTDFSHSKGVKGIPVRLCAKTELVGPSNPGPREVCYCKVKLFRDHGAERKLSNDVAHVKKTIDKLNQQIAQIESGAKELGKRKRGSASKSGDEPPEKVQKHRRTWSMSSVTSTSGRNSTEDDLHVKLMNLQDMFTSTRPASVFYLRGADEDDPDLFPVRLLGEIGPMPRTDSGETSGMTWDRQSTEATSIGASPTSSQRSPEMSRRDSIAPAKVETDDWRYPSQSVAANILVSPIQRQISRSADKSVKVQTRSPSSGRPSDWIEAVGVDSTYQPPAERPIKPVACFYIKPRLAHRNLDETLYRAVYIAAHTLKDFVNAVAQKCNIESTKVLQTVRVNKKGLNILFDDDCVLELREGQDMIVEVSDIHSDSPLKTRRDWDAGPTDVQCDGDIANVESLNTSGYELKLFF
ncbi:transcription factor BOM, protein [Acrodontium crateriforme]|uniref:Transcription factor BOM, protein n=1 Tax=Acrodontium crateriforme TaxID=150365 RepID=A0AAQ3RBX9_9PEZI|nr:transcription factor BOM, protein [Acrodontium crateriforme]